MQSNAVSQNNISAVVGYMIGKGYFNPTSPNLPQNINILGEASTANQSGLSLQPLQITNTITAATNFGYGSPIYSVIRILFNAGVSIPIWVYPQAAAVGSAAKVITLTVAGTPTSNGTAYLNIAGREGIDGQYYAINVVSTDTQATICAKAVAAVAAVLGAPVTGGAITGAIGTSTLGVGGTGYAVNDTFTVNTGTTLAVGTVLTESAGVVLTYSIAAPAGAGYVVANGVATTHTLGTGTGLTINITALGTCSVPFTSKWTGLTSNDLSIWVDLGLTSMGVTYTTVSTTAGSGTPSIGSGTGNTTGLDFFANQWKTIVINTYGFVTAVINSLEAYNGIPDPVTPTGQFAGIVMRPLFAFTGTCLDDPTSLTGITARQNQVTMVSCPTPLSQGMPYEGAANFAVLWANVAENTPHLDILDQTLPDMPGPLAGNIPQMTQYTFRQKCVTNGCSTVDYNGAYYTVKDFITTYNLSGEFPPFYRYVRDLNIHYNYKFGYRLLQVQKCVGKALVPDEATVSAANVMKPKVWLAAVQTYNKQCEKKAWIVNVDTAPPGDTPTNQGISVSISSTNPNRMDTVETIYLSGYGRVFATTVDGGFSFGTP